MPAKLGSLSIIEQSVMPKGDAEHLPLKPSRTHQRVTTAIVYCEGNFAAIDGKTANGLVRHFEKYTIVSVIDSEKFRLDSGTVLDDKTNNIPICKDLADVLAQCCKHARLITVNWFVP